MNKVVTFGEILIRFSTERHLRFSQAESYKTSFGGGEFNVAVSLANYGIKTEFVTRLPNNELANAAIKEMRKLNIQNHHISFGGNRLGLYFLETGASSRASNVIYDRENSAMATVEKGTFDWETILKDATWFHWSGITTAISESAADECYEAIKVAHKLGLTISTDLNYRSKLWQYGKDPKDVIPKLLAFSNIILGDIDTAFLMLGLDAVNPDYNNVESTREYYDSIFKHCPNLKLIATTLRYSISASHQRIGGVLYNGSKLYQADLQDVTPVVDRVGSGDAFMAGFIYGLLEENVSEQRALNFAVAACCLKHSVAGDYNLVSVEEVDKLVQGDFSAKVTR